MFGLVIVYKMFGLVLYIKCEGLVKLVIKLKMKKILIIIPRCHQLPQLFRRVTSFETHLVEAYDTCARKIRVVLFPNISCLASI